jgi:manganese transport protein
MFCLFFCYSQGFRWIESIVGGLIFIILACFVYELIISKPAINEVLGGLFQKEIIQNPAMLYIAIGILGATVMPHNLYFTAALSRPEIMNVLKKEKRGY